MSSAPNIEISIKIAIDGQEILNHSFAKITDAVKAVETLDFTPPKQSTADKLPARPQHWKQGDPSPFKGRKHKTFKCATCGQTKAISEFKKDGEMHVDCRKCRGVQNPGRFRKNTRTDELADQVYEGNKLSDQLEELAKKEQAKAPTAAANALNKAHLPKTEIRIEQPKNDPTVFLRDDIENFPVKKLPMGEGAAFVASDPRHSQTQVKAWANCLQCTGRKPVTIMDENGVCSTCNEMAEAG